MSMAMDPNAMPHTHGQIDPVAPGTPTAQQQEHPPVWDSHPDHHKWTYDKDLGGWTHSDDPETLCVGVGPIPFQPTYGYPPPHPQCLVGLCQCEWGKAGRAQLGLS